ncbi:DUF4129 domain-containing protein [Ammoniphilus sp. CFH 90114]|uniref:DUF4129 domain-containing protein n=1 Tax=Ammoniphilus sp. CFH 90114 TaxID=2493665 RepID=UPI00100F14BB|nr:DUF4129 domain-containing protein [Ammoniphilus sp. CFH 90114]RXT03794.1 DUF4129 domain-containing protein [Ammoniphilus sp. CFH 90114]
MSLRSALKRGICLYSEGIWLYFGLALYAKIEWQRTELFLPWTWLFIGVTGFLIPLLLQKWTQKVSVLFGVSLIALLPQLYGSWKLGIQAGYGYAGLVTFLLFVLYVRSGYLVYHEPTRVQLILRFEGNVILYILFVLFMTVNPDVEQFLHLPFVVGILASLMAIVFTLQPEEAGQESVQVRTVGSMGNVAVPMLGVVLLGILFGLSVLMPQVRTGMVGLLTNLAEGGVWLGKWALGVITWLLSLVSVTEEMGVLPPAPGQVSPGNQEGEWVQSLSFPWQLVLFLLLVSLIVVLWLVFGHRPRMKPVSRSPVKIRQTWNRPSWKAIWSRLVNYLRQCLEKWRRKFPGYYALQLYWYFHQVEQWGRKQGVTRLAAETPREYSIRLAGRVELSDAQRSMLIRLGDCYTAAYYSGGRKVDDREFGQLITELRGYRTS